MKKLLSFLFALFFAGAGFSQTRKLSLEQGQNVAKPELVVQEMHGDHIKKIKYSANGKFLLSTDKYSIKIWDADSGVLLRTLSDYYYGKSTTMHSADISADGTFCAYIGTDSRLHVCDIATGTIRYGDELKVGYPVAISPDGKHILAVEKSSLMKLSMYDTQSLKRQSVFDKVFYKSINEYSPICFTSDSRFVAWIPYNRESVVIVDMQTQRTVHIFRESKSIGNFALSPDGKYLAYYFNLKKVTIVDIDSGKKVKTLSTKYLYDLKFSQDENTLYTIGQSDTGFIAWDFIKGKKKFKCDEKSGGCIAVRPNSQEYAISQPLPPIDIHSASDGSKIRSIASLSDIKQIQYIPSSGNFFSSSHAESEGFIFDRNFSAKVLKDIVPQNLLRSYSGFSICDGGIIYIENETVFYLDFTNNTVKSLIKLDKGIGYVQLLKNSDCNTVAIKKDYTVFVYDIKKNTCISSFKTKEKYSGGSLSPSRQFALIGKYEDTEIFDIQSGNRVSINGEFLTFSPDDSLCAFGKEYKDRATNNDISVTIYNTKTWKPVYDGFIGKYTGIDKNICFSSDNTYFSMHSYDVSKNEFVQIVYKLSDTSKISKKIFPGNCDECFFIDNDKKFVMLNNGLIRCYNVYDTTLIVSAMANSNGDWFTYTPEGYFSGNEGGIKNFVHLVNGMEVTGLDQVAETLFRPDLVAAKLRGEDISKQEGTTSLSELVSSGEAPLVTFTNPPASSSNRDITVNFSVQDAGGGVGSVYLKINGKVIQLADGSRKLELVGGVANTTQKSSGKTTNFSHLLTLQNGENTLEAYATNAAGKIESRHAVTKISWQGSTAKPNLYVLAVGVNKYRDKSLWLNYAVPDATSIADQFRSVKGNLYQSVNVTTVFDGDVTADGISSAFNSLAGKVGADDVFIFYLSGHGTTHTDGDYYFIPVDFRFRNAQSVPETAVSKHFITEQLSKIKAQKTLVMLDTCNSGAFISTGARGMAEKTAIDRLSRATGQATIAASSDTQSAMEGYEGHGIFTFVILEGLSGKADANKDGYVSLSELSQYAEEKVPDYSYAKWGYEQYPQVDLRKQSNFPLVGK